MGRMIGRVRWFTGASRRRRAALPDSSSWQSAAARVEGRPHRCVTLDLPQLPSFRFYRPGA
jgi:hypothetical protein